MYKKYCIAFVIVLTLGMALHISGCGEKEGASKLGCKLSGSWVTVQDYLFEKNPTKYSGASSIAFDKLGNTYVFGWGGDDANYASGGFSDYKNTIVQKSVDSGKTWEVLEEFQNPAGFSSPITEEVFYQGEGGIVTDANNNVYYTTSVVDLATLKGRWYVRKSTDFGKTWRTVNIYPDTGDLGFGSSIAVDQSGNIFTTGYLYPLSTGIHEWKVFKSSDSGSSWKTVNSFQYVATKVSKPSAVRIHPNGDIFIAGEGADASSYHWIVRKSTNQGTTWSTSDNYQKISTSTSSWARDIAFDTNGNIYVVGLGRDGTVGHWIVRKSTDGGKTWETVDDYRLNNPTSNLKCNRLIV